MTGALTVTCRNHLTDLPRVQDEVEQFLVAHRASSDSLFLARLAIEELGSNVIRHAFRDNREHEFRVVIQIDARTARLTIEDEGEPFDPNSQPPLQAPDEHEQLPTGGMGIGLVTGLLGPIQYVRADGRNRQTVSIEIG